MKDYRKIMLTYEDKEYGESDSTIVLVSSSKDLNKLRSDFYKFSALYCSGNEFGEALERGDIGELANIQKTYNITEEDIVYFAEKRATCGLSSDAVAESFAEKYPEYELVTGIDEKISFCEYDNFEAVLEEDEPDVEM